jgi:nucleoside 2-deoxyribosyltransferase
MWFNPLLRPDYDQGIEPAVSDAGYQAIRVDAQEFNSDVVERIIAGIRESRFVVADVTGQRNGVYFEGGFALGLGLPVIWMCREDEVEKLHFDTRQLNHIVWKDSATIREKLSRRILATIGRGSAKDSVVKAQ